MCFPSNSESDLKRITLLPNFRVSGNSAAGHIFSTRKNAATKSTPNIRTNHRKVILVLERYRASNSVRTRSDAWYES